jgi:hypothetical protein
MTSVVFGHRGDMFDLLYAAPSAFEFWRISAWWMFASRYHPSVGFRCRVIWAAWRAR